MRKLIVITLTLTLITSIGTLADNGRAGWKRNLPESEIGLQLFHSPHAFGLPTAETHRQGDFEFEISHRFLPPVSDGHEALYGFDGPVNMRLALGVCPY